ncbi:putative quinol monooxygenase [Paraburkholderia sp. RL17-337-BIB-A]|uniref:putative quinol monooxygenase n=1 Tax=Paraburkholderia sp. RL17-337-BIB-A TaxID=3031636 RepID=UPI0038B7A4A3
MKRRLAVVGALLVLACRTGAAQVPSPAPPAAASSAPAAAPVSAAPLYVVTYYELLPASQPGPTGARPPVIFADYVAKATNEPGAMSFRILDDAERHSRYVVLEVWADGAAFDQHRRAESTVALRQQIGEWLVGPSDQRIHGRMQ